MCTQKHWLMQMRFSVYAKHTDYTNVFPDVHHKHWLVNKGLLCKEVLFHYKGCLMINIVKNGMYFISK